MKSIDLFKDTFEYPKLDNFYQKHKSWKEVRLAPDLSENCILSVSSGSTPLTKENSFWNGDIVWITPKDITSMKNENEITESQRKLTDEGVNNASLKIYPPQTVFVTKRAPVGKACINLKPACCNQGVFAVEVNKMKLNPLFFLHWVEINEVYLNKIANGSTFKELYKDDLNEICLFVPDIREQDEIIMFLGKIEYKIMHIRLFSKNFPLNKRMEIQEELISLFKLFDSLKFGLLSGLIQVNDAKKQMQF